MRRAKKRRLDAVRRDSSELENHLIDEYATGRISRRQFVGRGTAIGMSLPAVSLVLAACGSDNTPSASTATTEARAVRGGRFQLAVAPPSAEPGPLTVNDNGGGAVLSTGGEFLTNALPDGEVIPKLAARWAPNDDASVWTFTLQRDVLFHNGKPLTAADVAASFNRQLSDTGGSGTAKANLAGVLSAGATKAQGDVVVVFELDAPSGSFPALIGSNAYTCIITPADIRLEDWVEKGMVGTGPYKLQKYTPRVGAEYVRNDDYWDKQRPPLLDAFALRFYDSEAAMVVALQGGQVDGIGTLSPISAEPLIDDPRAKVVSARSAEHRELHMRADGAPFDDKRVRKAIALSLDRDAIVRGLYPEGFAEVGNDHPFAPLWPYTDKTVPQRTQDLEQAKQLLADAGVEPGSVRAELTTWNGLANPDYAQLVKRYADEIGVKLDLNIVDAAGYYGGDTWLTCQMGITEYGGRPVPNAYLTAPLRSDGVWNAAQFRNPEYDRLAASFMSSLDLQDQRRYARQIEELLLEETPIIIGFFVHRTDVVKPNVVGWQGTGTVTFDPSLVGYAA